MQQLPKRERRQAQLSALLLGLAALALYAITWRYGILGYDDTWLVRDNPLLSQPGLPPLGAIFFDLSRETRFVLGSEFLPVRDLSVALDSLLFGNHYGAFHATQTLYYAVACALLLWALWRWSGQLELSIFAALLFASHPIHVESVAWLSERKGVLALLFVALTFVAFRRAVEAEERGRFARRVAIATLCSVLALWSKGLAIAQLAALLALVLLYLQGSARRRGLVAIAVMAPLLGLAFLPLWITGQRMDIVSTFHGGSFAATAALAAKAHALYLGRAALWVDAAIAYPLEADTSALPQLLLGAAAFVIAAIFALYGLRRGSSAKHLPSESPLWRSLTLAATIWLAFLLPVSHLLFPLQNAAADRYVLLPSLGWALALAALAQKLPLARLRRGLLLLLCVAQVLSTAALTRAWRSDEALYSQTHRAYPRYLPALLQLSRLARERGALDEAQRWLDRAKGVAPGDYRVDTHRALLALARGDAAAAITAFRRATRHDKARRARSNLALLLLRRGERKEALKLAREGAHLGRLNHHAQHTLGVVALQTGSLVEAEGALLLAARLKSKHAPTHFNLAVLALNKGNRQAARRHLRQALLIDHRFAPALRLRQAMDADDAKGAK